MIKRSFEDTHAVLKDGCGSWYSKVDRLVRMQMNQRMYRENGALAKLYHTYYSKGLTILEEGCGMVWVERDNGQMHYWKTTGNYNRTELFMVCGIRGWMHICASVILRKCCGELDQGHEKMVGIEKAQLMELEKVLGLKW